MRALLPSLALLSLVALSAADTTIDTYPTSGSNINLVNAGGSASVGESFTAPTGENLLTGFTLTAHGLSTTDTGTFQVYAFTGDTLGALLYQSAPFAFTNSFADRTFAPNLAVTPGATYLALLTSSQGQISAAFGSAYAGGEFYARFGNGSLLQAGSSDLAFRATFASSVQATPEPFTMTLGAAAFGVAIKRRRKA